MQFGFLFVGVVVIICGGCVGNGSVDQCVFVMVVVVDCSVGDGVGQCIQFVVFGCFVYVILVLVLCVVGVVVGIIGEQCQCGDGCGQRQVMGGEYGKIIFRGIEMFLCEGWLIFQSIVKW